MKVLFINYHFPPHGGGGVLRAVKLCKYLPEFGITPVVLCADDKHYHTRDETLLDDIAESVEVNRVKFYQAPRPTSAMRRLAANKKGKLPFISRIRRFFTFPDPSRGYRRVAFKKCDELLAKGSFSAILSTYPPPSTHVVAYKLAEKWKLPLVLDYRDAWYFDPIFTPPTALHRHLIYRLEKKLLKRADAVITVGDTLAADFKEYYPFLEEVGVVTNGYDEDDFTGVSPASRGKFTITYTGWLYSGRLPGTFLSGLGRCFRNGVIAKREIEFRIIGNTDENVKAYIRNSGVPTKIIGKVNHRTAITEMLSADANLLIIDDGPGAEAILTGKVFEYLRAGRPIIAIVPPSGEAAGLIRRLDAGYVIAPGDEEKAAEVITELYGRYRKEGTIKNTTPREGIDEFSRKSLAERYAAIIRNAVKQ
ncbi:MAG: glycosyltransferase family 4 protein [bacterium]|nr:glycosyltransferase family 4 protein [bacterium]